MYVLLLYLYVLLLYLCGVNETIMNKINITIPDNLSPKQELEAVLKQLGKNLLPTGDKKLLGNGYEIKHLETQITIKREVVEKPIVTRCCSFCEAVFEQTIGKVFWVNYGGKQRKNYYCSDGCRSIVMDIVGKGRASISRKTLLNPLAR